MCTVYVAIQSQVQDIAIASDSRWVAASTLNGTTHIFPVTPYGGKEHSHTFIVLG